jgi:hypothetical protein
MLTVDDFKTRVKALWRSQQNMAAAKKWKTGKHAGTIRVPAAPIEFTEYQFGEWLWKKVGLNAIQCPYCNAPIDVLSLTVDHITPRSAGGHFELPNMQCICVPCNERKGNFSAQAYDAILQFMRASLGRYDQNILLSRLKAANAGSGRRFFRDKKKAPKQEVVFELPPF